MGDGLVGFAAAGKGQTIPRTMSVLRLALVSMASRKPTMSGDFTSSRRISTPTMMGTRALFKSWARRPADQRAEAFKALGAKELFLQLFVFGDVGVDEEQRFSPAALSRECR